jgi:hypothetical protein
LVFFTPGDLPNPYCGHSELTVVECKTEPLIRRSQDGGFEIERINVYIVLQLDQALAATCTRILVYNCKLARHQRMLSANAPNS